MIKTPGDTAPGAGPPGAAGLAGLPLLGMGALQGQAGLLVRDHGPKVKRTGTQR